MDRSPAHSAEPLSRFVDEYLSYLHETCPTAAAADGVHLHDDLLEDFSRSAVDAQVRELGGWARRLDGIKASTLSAEEKLERRMLADGIRARLFGLEDVRVWQRSPLHYAETIAESLAGQVLFDHAPVTERARRVVSKLRQVPRLLESARQNVTDPPGLFVRVGLESFDGVLKFVERDLPRAFRNLEDMHLLGDLADASTVAVDAVRDYGAHLRDAVAPRSRASFRLGADRFAQKLRLDEGIDVPVDRLLQVALRELGATQERFREVAAGAARGPGDAWQKVKARHPDADGLLSTVEGHLAALLDFIRRKRIVTVPDHGPLVVAPTPEYYRGTFAGIVPVGPFEERPLPAYYYITNVDPSWPADRQEEHLRDFSYAALWSISIHEAFPGHFLHFEHLRRVASPLRKSTFFTPVSLVEGWAHYCEQMMFDEGFERGNPEVELGQLAEALVRLARTVVGIRLHTEDLSVEQGVRFFRDEAFLEEGSARREAERGTYDPGYVLYSLGKLMLLKLRRDCEAAGNGGSLQSFHDRFLGHGGVPFWMHRQLMLGATGTLLE